MTIARSQLSINCNAEAQKVVLWHGTTRVAEYAVDSSDPANPKFTLDKKMVKLPGLEATSWMNQIRDSWLEACPPPPPPPQTAWDFLEEDDD